MPVLVTYKSCVLVSVRDLALGLVNRKYDLLDGRIICTYDLMVITYDSAKNANNIVRRDLSFDLVHRFEWNSALVVEDNRREYTEQRYQALGNIGYRLYMLVFTIRGDDVRVISLRKANSREVARYEKAQSRID